MTTADLDGARRLVVDGEPVTDTAIQVDAVLSVGEDGVLVVGTDDPTQQHLWRWTPGAGVERLTGPGGVHTGAVARAARWSSPASPPASPPPWSAVHRSGHEPRRGRRRTPRRRRRCRAPTLLPGRRPRPRGRASCCPRDHVPGTPLPVLMDPYGGPHHREVVDSPKRWLRGRSGSPTRASPWSWPTVAAPAAAGRTGTAAIRDEFATVAARGPGRGPARRSPTWCPTST